MDYIDTKKLLEAVSAGSLSPEEAAGKLADSGYEDLGFARVDHNRNSRCGFPEVIFCQGKTPDQVADISAAILKRENRLLATRADRDVYIAIREQFEDARYNERARTVTVVRDEIELKGIVPVVTGGTSDLPVAEEAAETAAIMGCQVKKLYDAGVAGIHRLLRNTDIFEDAKVVVVAAGMEGALPSVVGGLVACPVIAVPTSVGYGAHFNGLAALLAMLNSCASNVLVTNIDNGFRAGYTAALIARQGSAAAT